MCVSSVPTGLSTGWSTGLWMLTLPPCASQVGFARRVAARPAALQSDDFEVRAFRQEGIFAIADRCSYLLPASLIVSTLNEESRLFVYYESLKRELKTKNYIWISV